MHPALPYPSWPVQDMPQWVSLHQLAPACMVCQSMGLLLPSLLPCAALQPPKHLHAARQAGFQVTAFTSRPSLVPNRWQLRAGGARLPAGVPLQHPAINSRRAPRRRDKSPSQLRHHWGFRPWTSLAPTCGRVQVARDFRQPQGTTPDELDAIADGDLFVVLDLRGDEGLSQARVAREVTTRVQKLRKASSVSTLRPSRSEAA